MAQTSGRSVTERLPGACLAASFEAHGSFVARTRVRRRTSVLVLSALVASACSTAPVPTSAPSSIATAGPTPGTEPTSPPASPRSAGLELGVPTDPIVGDPFGGPGSGRLSASLAYRSGFLVGGARSTAGGHHLDPAIWLSPDGRSWVAAAMPENRFDAADVTDLVEVDGGLLALGEERMASEDDDAPGESVLWRSDDGLDWERVTPMDPDLAALDSFAIRAGASGLVAWSYGNDGGPQVLLSDDGIDWTPVDTDVFDDAALLDIATSSHGYVAVGGLFGDDCTTSDFEPARAWWSADAATWHRADVDVGAELELAFPFADGFLAWGMPSGCGTDYIERAFWHSDDGRSWSLGERNRTFREVFASDGTRLIGWDRLAEDFSNAGPGEMRISLDGRTWQSMGTVDSGTFDSEALVIGEHGLLLVLFDTVDDRGGVQFIPYR